MPAKKAAPALDPVADRVDVEGLRDFQRAQISEALETPRTFVMKSGKEYAFKAQVDWSYKAEVGLAIGNAAQWANGALDDPDADLEDFLGEKSRDIMKLFQFYMDQGGLDQGEDSSSSAS